MVQGGLPRGACLGTRLGPGWGPPRAASAEEVSGVLHLLQVEGPCGAERVYTGRRGRPWAGAPQRALPAPLTCLRHRLQRVLQLANPRVLRVLQGPGARPGGREAQGAGGVGGGRGRVGAGGTSPGAATESLHQEPGQVVQDGLAVQVDKLLAAHLGEGTGGLGLGLRGQVGSRPLPCPAPPWWRDGGRQVPAATGLTWFMTATSAAWVQKQSCTDTKVRPFLRQRQGLL